ncbi:hypothetical protein KGP36_04950 [Patescibacteria group bacterium]|nr:hypothetical protein [Patescibacteria group bacterium]MDE1941115.1 hypothetical protein [Patescibacteria group bacterium]
MPAAERSAFIQEVIASLPPDASTADLDSVRDLLDTLIGKGHAPDCPAANGKGECACGHADAEKWASEYPPSEETVAE